MKKILIYTFCFFILLYQTTLANEFRFSPRPNNAHHIDWHQWNQVTLEKAKNEDKMILLSLSAVWCHWCHVTDETTYSDMDIIKFINKNFIPVRVDSDMRPDIDGLYNQGGWPSTVILTPEGEIMEGGTYIPPQKMLSMLSSAVELYTKERENINVAIADIRKKKISIKTSEGRSPDNTDIIEIRRVLKSSYDKKHGGFGVWQKFPNHDAIDFAISEYIKNGDPDIKNIINNTLINMYKGDIYDKIEGGFFRYSTKPDWSEPHYEKMLESNAGIIRNYSDSFMVFGDKSYEKVLKNTIKYIKSNLLDKKTGAFYGSQDADEVYYKKENRRGLQPPYIDQTIYADSSSLMISAILSAYSATQKGEYLNIAEKACNFIFKALYAEKDGVFHYYSDNNKHLKGLLSDNVLYALSLIDIYNVTGKDVYMNRAKQLGSFIINRFYDYDNKRFISSINTTIIRPAVTGRLSDFNTTLINYKAAILLSKLYYVNKVEKYKKVASDVLKTYRDSYKRFTTYAPVYGTALRWHLGEPVEIVIVSENKKIRSFFNELNKIYIPEKTIKVLRPSQDKELTKKSGYLSHDAVYICVGKRCLLPVSKPGKLKKVLDKLIQEKIS